MLPSERYLLVVRNWLDNLQAENRLLPGISGHCSFAAVSRETGVPIDHFVKGSPHRKLVEDRFEQLGIDQQRPRGQSKRSGAADLSGAPTYGDLQSNAKEYFLLTGLSEGSIPSYLSTIRSWMKRFNLTSSSSTEPHLGTQFEQLVAEFKDLITPSSESRLRRWIELQRYILGSHVLPKTFSAALSDLVARSGKSQHRIAREIGISNASLQKWVDGQYRPDDFDEVRLLETALGVTPGLLIQRLPSGLVSRKRFQKIPEEWWPNEWGTSTRHSGYRNARHAVMDLIPKHLIIAGGDELKHSFDIAVAKVSSDFNKIEYNTKFKNGIKTYRLNIKFWPKRLSDEWISLKKYKMEPDNFSNEARNGKWCESTALMNLNLLERFYGYLCLPYDNENPIRGGQGLERAKLTIGLVSSPSLVKSFLDFLHDRSGNYNHGTQTAISSWSAMLRANSGWIWQHPELQLNLMKKQRDEVRNQGGWQKYCMNACIELRNSLRKLQSRGQIKFSRQPFLPILPILDHPEPIQLVIKSLDYYQAELEKTKRQSNLIAPNYATKWRNLFLISFLIRLPLRAKQWTTMTYKIDNSGNLRRDLQGCWWIVLPFDEFKNHRNRKIFVDQNGQKCISLSFNDHPLNSLLPILEVYIEKYWPTIVGDSDRLFPSLSGQTFTTSSLAQVIRDWTREYVSEQSLRKCGIPGVLPFTTHAFRDIVATHVIKTTGSIEMAADILLDSPETVAKHYARFLPNDRLKRVFQAMGVFT